MKQLFEYLDYREYLADYYQEQKQKDALFSYRYFSKQSGLDASFLVKLLHKSTNLSLKSVPRIIEFLQLTGKEQTYFELLVHYNRAKKASDRQLYFEKLLTCRPLPSQLKPQHDQKRLLSHWYTIAVGLFCAYLKSTKSPKEIAQRLIPRISEMEVADAIAVLKQTASLIQQPDGSYTMTEPVVFDETAAESTQYNDIKRQFLELGVHAFERFTPQEHNAPQMTMAMTPKMFEMVKEKILSLSKEILESVKKEDEPHAIYQVNLCIFPVTKPLTPP
ncbi:MAG: TIGR02147 family protein [Chitinivibrionales bacterium]|nr:TIGR02147 family protein [Chitinivibrionales bacterium]